MTPEGIVLADCKKILKKLEFMGWVSHWERINVGLFYTLWGGKIKIGREDDADLWVFVPVDNIMWIMFFECKDPIKGEQSDGQIEFENKFVGFHNVIYQIITDAKQIKITVDNARKKSKTYGKLESWELPDHI